MEDINPEPSTKLPWPPSESDNEEGHGLDENVPSPTQEERGRKRKRGKERSHYGGGNNRGRAPSHISLSSSSPPSLHSRSSSRSLILPHPPSRQRRANSSSPSGSNAHPRSRPQLLSPYHSRNRSPSYQPKHSRSRKHRPAKRRRSQSPPPNPPHKSFWKKVRSYSDETVEALQTATPDVLRTFNNQVFANQEIEMRYLQHKYNQLKRDYRQLQETVDKLEHKGRISSHSLSQGGPSTLSSSSFPQPQPTLINYLRLENGQELFTLPTVEPVLRRPDGFRGFWTNAEWMSHRGGKQKPRNSSFLVEADGSPISEDECKIIRKTLRSTLNFLGVTIPFRLHGNLNSKQFRDHVTVSLESAHPGLGQCQHHWKVQQLVIENYKTWLQSFFTNYGAEMLSPVDIPRVYFGQWSQGKYAKCLRLTPEQIAELKEPPLADSQLQLEQGKPSKYASALASNQEPYAGHPNATTPGRIAWPSSPTSRSSATTFSIILSELSRNGFTPLPSPRANYARDPFGPFSLTVAPLPFSRHHRSQADQNNALSVEQSTSLPQVQQNLIPVIDPALVEKSIRARQSTRLNEESVSQPPPASPFLPTVNSTSLSLNFPNEHQITPTPPSPVNIATTFSSTATATNPACAISSSETTNTVTNLDRSTTMALDSSIITPATAPLSITTQPTPSPVIIAPPPTHCTTTPPSAAATNPASSVDATSASTILANSMDNTASLIPEAVDTASAAETRIPLSSGAIEDIPAEYNKELWLGRVRDFKKKTTTYCPRNNDKCPENLAGADWATKKVQANDPHNKNQDFAEYWGGMSASDKKLWFEKAKLLGYAVGNEVSRKSKKKTLE
ncbi:hypothetical protein Agabi119p4_10732 [Agaricus bisporus var. burnettii]|uniref:Uncharacterized protein n=1 Tax=Agaricus bisporus var. burnettii TaxID=192524 RepID=A0A8H7C353_AGABI|nr:hypothetical protein Agabi119p4_10732 [Agaricus bisporus var. burnettii]